MTGRRFKWPLRSCANEAAEGVAVRLGDEHFNIMVTLEPKTENTFDLEEPC